MVKANVEQWLDDAVIGLNLCPFAAKPRKKKAIRIALVEATKAEQALSALQSELVHIDGHSRDQVETTLLVIERGYESFLDFNELLYMADELLAEAGWEGEYQVASFHPDYQFDGTQPDDAENLTNRAPYPILHIIREVSIDEAVEKFPDTEAIPEANVRRIGELSSAERERIFPYLFSGS